MAPNSRARGRRSRATALRQQTDPTRWRRPTIRPTRFGTAWAAAGRRPTSNPVRGERSIIRGRGAGAVGVAGERSAVQPAKGLKDQRNSWFVSLFGAAVQPRGHRRSMALKDQQKRGAFTFLAPNPRAREARARRFAQTTGPTHDQTDPLWHRLGGGWPTSNFESGSGRTIDHARPRRWCGRRRGRAPRGSASQRPEGSAE